MVFRVRVDIVMEEKVFRVRVCVLFPKRSLELGCACFFKNGL